MPEAIFHPSAEPRRRAAAGRRERPRVASVLGVPFTLARFPEAVDLVRGMLASGRPHQLVLANAHTLNLAWDDPDYRRVLAGAALVLRDGIGVEMALRLATLSRGDNFVGTDFVPALLRALGPAPVRVFLFGARPGVAETAGRRLGALPHVTIAGTADGYGDWDAVVPRVAAAGADVLLVALGNPAQERWIARHLDRLHVRLAIGVGALFDFLAGRVPRAPQWMVRARAEWVFRMIVEPHRLWRRYVLGNPRFLWRVLRHPAMEAA